MGSSKCRGECSSRGQCRSVEENAAVEENAGSLEENEATEVAAWYVCNLSIFLHLFSFLSMAKLISV